MMGPIDTHVSPAVLKMRNRSEMFLEMYYWQDNIAYNEFYIVANIYLFVLFFEDVRVLKMNVS